MKHDDPTPRKMGTKSVPLSPGNQLCAARSGARSDRELQRDAINSLSWLFEDGTTGIAVSIVHGRATLSGMVQYPSQRAAAEEAARAIRGITEVDNQLLVAEIRR